jgi:hypothetical protein
MPTNIIGSQAPSTTAGSTWGAMGSGLQGLGALLGQAFAAKSAADAAKRAAAPPPVVAPAPIDPMSNLGVDTQAMPIGILGDPQATMDAVTASAPAPVMQRGMMMGKGLSSVFAQRFPQLFPQASGAFKTFQYGGQ